MHPTVLERPTQPEGNDHYRNDRIEERCRTANFHIAIHLFRLTLPMPHETYGFVVSDRRRRRSGKHLGNRYAILTTPFSEYSALLRAPTEGRSGEYFAARAKLPRMRDFHHQEFRAGPRDQRLAAAVAMAILRLIRGERVRQALARALRCR